VSIYRGPYYSADGCDSSAKPGTDALVAWYLGAYRAQGATNLGTYVCKRLGSGWSIHAERRAADLGTSPYGGVDSSWGWALANAFRLNSAELGIQLIILDHKVWSCRYPDSGWRGYSGEYHGHMHVELIPSAAQGLTVDKIQRIIGGDDVTPQELINTTLGSPSLGDRTVGDWWKAGESARREAEAAKNAAGGAATQATNAAQAAAQAASEAALAKDLAGAAGMAVGRVEGKVDELLARPPVAIDYRELAGALLSAVREEGQPS
jgi:hypothetical protein